jgi:hypothetical protein
VHRLRAPEVFGAERPAGGGSPKRSGRTFRDTGPGLPAREIPVMLLEPTEDTTAER